MNEQKCENPYGAMQTGSWGDQTKYGGCRVCQYGQSGCIRSAAKVATDNRE